MTHTPTMTNDVPTPSRLTVKDANDLLVFIGSIIAVCAWCWRKAIGACVRWVWNLLKAPNNIARIMDVLSSHDASIKTSLARHRATWNASTVPVVEANEDGLLVFVNNAYLRALGRREVEVLGRGWESVVHEGDRERVKDEWRNSVTGDTDFDVRFRWVSADGTVIHVHSRATRLTDLRNATLGWVSFIDIEDVEGFRKGHTNE